MFNYCVCGIWLDMTTPPWWREEIMVYYIFLGSNVITAFA